jgi:hypothetical protein
MRFPRSLIVAGLVAFVSTAAHAQACVGLAPFSSGPVRLDLGVALSDGVHGHGVGFAAGAASGPFASAGVSRVEYTDGTNAATSFDVAAGYSVDLAPKGAAQFCPIAQFTYQAGPDFDTGYGTASVSAHAVGLGGSFGGAVDVAPNFSLVPFAQAAYVLTGASASLAGYSASDNENHGEIGAGLGLVFNRVLTLQPAVSVPVGVSEGKATFQVSFALNFGGSGGR